MTLRNVLYAAGAAFIALGLAGLIASGTSLPGWALWFAGLAVAHDALLVPVVLGMSRLTRRAPWPFAAGLITAGAVTVVALPAVLGYGRRPDNPSVLPQAYGWHLVTVVIFIAVVTSALAVLNAYAHLMGKAILTIVGVLLAIWLIFMVVGMIISALKFLIWLGFLAVIGAIVVTLISKLAKSK
jgi:hypothetical protein